MAQSLIEHFIQPHRCFGHVTLKGGEYFACVLISAEKIWVDIDVFIKQQLHYFLPCKIRYICNHIGVAMLNCQQLTIAYVLYFHMRQRQLRTLH